MAIQKPDQFLDDAAPAVVNRTGSWETIRSSESLIPEDTASLRADLPPPQPNNDVLINSVGFWKGIKDDDTRKKNWNLSFSSERNAAYFSSVPKSASSRENNAWIGDEFGSPPAPGISNTFKLKADLCAAFEINLSRSTALKVFLDAIDASQTIEATLISPPNWRINDTTKKPDPSLGLELGQTVTNGNITNALWCISSEEAYSVTVKLSYQINSGRVVDDALKWITDSFDQLTPNKASDLLPITVTFTKTSLYWLNNPPTLAKKSTGLTLTLPILDFILNVDVDESGRTLLLIPNGNSSIKAMVTNAFGDKQNADLSLLPDGSGSDPFSSLFDHVFLWYIRLLDDTTQSSGSRIQWGIGLLSIWKPQGLNVVVGLTYDSSTSTFFGRLMWSRDFDGSDDVRLVDWDPRVDPNNVLKGLNATLPPSDQINPGAIGSSIDLWKMLGFDPESQPPIPHLLSAAEVSFQRSDTSGSIFSFTADITRDPGDQTAVSASSSQAAPSVFTWDEIAVSVSITSPPKNSPGGKSYSIDVYSAFTLAAPSSVVNPPPPASLAAGLHYDKTNSSSNWIVRASIQDVSVALLYSFFDDDARDGAMAVMSRIDLSSLDILYTYHGKEASSFLITGILTLGDLELDLSYQYVSALLDANSETATALYKKENADDGKLPANPSDQLIRGSKATQTRFIARLSVGSPGSTIASVAESIVRGAGDKLPEWVGGIEIKPKNDKTPTVELQFSSKKSTDAKQGNSSVLTVWLSIAGFSLTFIQYQTPSSTDGTTKTPGITKRLIRISVDQIPMMDKIPLIGELPQPFDHLEYVWVEDDNPSKTLDNTLKGIQRAELGAIKSQYPDDIPAFQIKESKTPKDNDVVLQAGHHFIVIVSGKVVLDHVFNADKTSTQPESSKPANALAVKNDANAAPASAGSPPADTPPTKGDTNTSAGPLTISALTLQYKDGSLLVSIDASLKLGPIVFAVKGFVIQIDLSQVKLNDLAAIVTKGLIHASLHGLEVGVEQGPLTLKGVFIHDEEPGIEKYTGGIAVGFKAWQVLAVGQYTIKQNHAGDDAFRAVFVYGKLDGPLIELEFATISGVRLGFGYNYAVRSPQIKELSTYPFIADSAASGVGNDPMKVLDKLVYDKPYVVYPKQGSGWFCAGMTITAFDVLTLTAVLMVDIDTGMEDSSEKGVILTLLADGVFQMEPLTPPEFSLFYIEIIVSFEMNFVHGYIAANATLSPASHVYVPAAHLSGQAAFYTWFGQNPNAGDWVVTVGGYARQYDPPAHYPSNLDRISLNFTVGDNIQIIGTAYLAVTPKCAMAGGTLHLSLSVGPVSAYADIILDAFINFKPFHFRAEISLSVGIECDIDILFIHIHISLHLGADLVLWGPHDFGGHAHVDFWFFGFDIDFGAIEGDQKDPISLFEFFKMVKAPGPDSQKPTTDTIGTSNTTNKTQHKYSVEAGLMPASTPPPNGGNFPSTGATTLWEVQAGPLVIRLDCGFALSAAVFIVPNEDDDLQKRKNNPTVESPISLPKGVQDDILKVHSWPMHSKKENAIMSKLEIRVYQTEDSKNPRLVGDFKGELVLKSAATALWGVWDSQQDPLHTKNPGNLLNGDKGTVDLVQGVRILPPDPRLCPSPILDFDASAAMRETIVRDQTPDHTDGKWYLPAGEEQDKAFTGQYFEPDVKDDDVAAQTKRWHDFSDLWNPPKPVNDSVTVRTAVVKQIADVLLWTVRPPEQMQGNTPPVTNASSASGTTGTSPAGIGDTTAPIKGPNQPRINADGRTDWELLDGPPARLAAGLDTFYPALPYACATA